MKIQNTKEALQATNADLSRSEFDDVNLREATFTNVKSHETFSTDAAKVESVDKSYENTRVDTSTDNGATVAKDIEVGGSKIKIDF